MPVGANLFLNTPGTPATPQFAEYVVKGSSLEADGGTKPFVNIFHFARVTGPGTGTELQLYTAIANVIDAAVSAALSSTYIAVDTLVRFMDDPTRNAVSCGNVWVGAIGGDRLPNFNATVVRKYTYGRGRSYRGSNHFGPIAESDTLLDNLTVAAQGRWAAVATALAACVNVPTADGSLWTLMVLSTVLSDLTVNPSLFTGSLVKSTLRNIRIGVMKHRKDNTGPSA